MSTWRWGVQAQAKGLKSRGAVRASAPSSPDCRTLPCGVLRPCTRAPAPATRRETGARAARRSATSAPPCPAAPAHSRLHLRPSAKPTRAAAPSPRPAVFTMPQQTHLHLRPYVEQREALRHQAARLLGVGHVLAVRALKRLGHLLRRQVGEEVRVQNKVLRGGARARDGAAAAGRRAGRPHRGWGVRVPQ